MFKYIHKISSYGDESRIDFNLSKRKRNYRFKDKVLYLKDHTVLLKDNKYDKNNRYWYKFVYVINDKLIFNYKNNYFMFKNNILYRGSGLPAIIKSNCNKYWFLNGILNREGGLPAVIRSNGDKLWYLNGILHREDGPALVSPYLNECQAWYLNGKLHREDGLPAVIDSTGYQVWYFNGVIHREDGLPAYIGSNGYQAWFLNGVQYTP